MSDRSRAIPLVAAAVLAALVVAWSWSELVRARAQGLREIQQQADAVTDTLGASLAAQVRRGLLPREHVGEVLESVVATGEVVFARLEQPGVAPVQAGSVPALGARASDDGGQLVGDVFVHWERVRLQDAPLPFRHRAPHDVADTPLPLADAGQFLVVGVPREVYDRHVRSAGLRVLATALAGFVAVALSGAAWALTLRNRGLRAALDGARLRQDHLQEMSLAAAGLAHETKNPLGIVRGLAQRLADDEGTPPAAQATAAAIVDEVDTAAARIGAFLAYASGRPPRVEPIDAPGLIARVRDLLAGDFAERGVALAAHAEPLDVDADRDMLKQILVNLLLNSLAATDRGGGVRVRLERDAGGGGTARLVVDDAGSGLPAEVRERLFKPYVTARAGGHGLGLALVKRIVDAHGWTIAVDSPADPATGRGTRVTVAGIAARARAAETAGTPA